MEQITSASLNVIGLLLNLFGVMLLFSYGMPFRVRTEGATHLRLDEVDLSAIDAEKRNTLLGWMGLLLIVAGTAAQIIANLV